MTGQPTLFADPNPAPMVRSGDPITSRLAAKKADINRGQQCVLAALTRLVTGTDEDIENAPECAQMGRGSARKRRLELQRAGLVVHCGFSFEPRRMMVFRVVEQ